MCDVEIYQNCLQPGDEKIKLNCCLLHKIANENPEELLYYYLCYRCMCSVYEQQSQESVQSWPTPAPLQHFQQLLLSESLLSL